MKSMLISEAMLLALSFPALSGDDKNNGDNGGVRSGQVRLRSQSRLTTNCALSCGVALRVVQ